MKAKKFLAAASDWHEMGDSSFSLTWDCRSGPALRPNSNARESQILKTLDGANPGVVLLEQLESPQAVNLTTRWD